MTVKNGKIHRTDFGKISKSSKEQPEKQKIKRAINFKIYLNTLKNAYNAIRQTGLNAEYQQVDKGEYIEVVVKIPKEQ